MQESSRHWLPGVSTPQRSAQKRSELFNDINALNRHVFAKDTSDKQQQRIRVPFFKIFLVVLIAWGVLHVWLSIRWMFHMTPLWALPSTRQVYEYPQLTTGNNHMLRLGWK
jgi:hypothetical protein